MAQDGRADWEDVEFLDPEESGAGDEVLWLDEEGVGSGRDPHRLPPHPSRARLLASLLAVALFLAGIGSASAAAYHRHLTDRLLADELVLRPSASPPAIPSLAALGFAATWHAQVTERVLVPVVNRSPRPVQLLGAVLTEPGLVAAVRLTPLGGPPLAPGATGELGGTVTADCTVASSVVGVSVLSYGDNTLTTAAVANLQVSARTSDGATGIVQLNPENANPDLQARICGQEGDDVTGAESVTEAADPLAHTVTVHLATRSNADVPLEYVSGALYRTGPTAGVVFSLPVPQTPTMGTVSPGAALAVTYVIDVSNCGPAHTPLKTAELQLQLIYSVGDTMLETSSEVVQLDPLLAQACGL
jgi:hypothetical protein